MFDCWRRYKSSRNSWLTLWFTAIRKYRNGLQKELKKYSFFFFFSPENHGQRALWSYWPWRHFPLVGFASFSWTARYDNLAGVHFIPFPYLFLYVSTHLQLTKTQLVFRPVCTVYIEINLSMKQNKKYNFRQYFWRVYILIYFCTSSKLTICSMFPVVFLRNPDLVPC